MGNRQFKWKLLPWLGGAAILCAATVHVAHSSQMKRHTQSFLAQADREAADGRPDRAAEYLKRYLAFRPSDTDALARYGMVLEQTAASGPGQVRAAEVFEQVLAKDRRRHDVRRRLVRLYLQMGWFARARPHAEVLARDGPDDATVVVVLGRCFEAEGDSGEARQHYQDAVAKDPHCLEAWVRLVDLLRRRQLMDLAAEQMDAMVRANDADPGAYLERAQFRLSGGNLDGAAEDLGKARILEPRDAHVLRASADLAQRRGDAGEARTWWKQGIAVHEDHPALAAGLAALELQQGRPEAALAVVEQAVDRHPSDAELSYLYTEALLQLGRFDKVGGVITEVRQRRRQPSLANYFEARLLQHQGRPLQAASLLRATLRQTVVAPGLAGHMSLCLGQACAQIGDSDGALAAYRQAVEAAPGLVRARVCLGAALLARGASDEADQHLDEATLLPLPPPETWTVLARARLRHTLTLPPSQRDWDGVEATFDRAGACADQAVPVALLRADALVARGQVADADAMLVTACAEMAASQQAEPLWAARARLAARLGQSRRAAEILDEARAALGDTAELRLAALECWPEPAGERTVAFLRAQEAGLNRFTAADRGRIQAALAAAHYRLGSVAEVDRLCRRLLAALGEKQGPADFDDWVRLLDLALQGNDDRLVAEVIGGFKKLEGEEAGAWWRYATAAHLVVKATRGDRAGLDQARPMLAKVTQLRPAWGRAVLLQGWLDDVSGDSARALDGYLRGFDLGERQLVTVQRLVQLLAERSRFADADDVLRRCQDQVIPRGDFARTAAEIALRVRNDSRAVALARLAVPDGTTDPARLVWLGQVYSAAGKPSQAEATFRAVIDRAFNAENQAWRYDPLDAWLALITHLARDRRPRKAEAAIEEMRRQLPPEQRPFALGVCFEALGQTGLAEEGYRAALAERNNEALLLQRLASLYIRTDRATKVEPLLLQMLGPAVVAPEASLAWARRHLALLIADRGGDDNYRAAVALLDANRRPGHEADADARALTFLRATRPEGREAALKALEQARSQQSLAPDELLRLARLYEEVAHDWPRAREVMEEALKADALNLEYLAHHVANLLKHQAVVEAGKCIERLAALEGESERVQRFRKQTIAPP
jgi:Flp pilus assembly protein TadD